MARADIPVRVTTPIEFHIDGKAVVLGPGDRLVLAFSDHLTHEQVHRMRDLIHDAGLGDRVLIVSGAGIAVLPADPDPQSAATAIILDGLERVADEVKAL